MPPLKRALGLIETMGFIGVTEAADAAVKAASVELSAVERIDGGLVSIRLLGDLGAVYAAIEAGAQAAQKVGTLISCHVIPNPHGDLVRLLKLQDTGAQAAGSDEALENLSVHRLRQLARETPSLSIQGREISRANRAQLLDELRRVRGEAE